MKFLSPHWLWLISALPLAYLWVVSDERRRRKRLEAFIAEPLWKSLIPGMDPRARIRKAQRALLALTFAFLALARPQWGMHEETVHVTGLDVMVVLDVSNSMEVEDIVPSRLKKARHLIKNLIEKLRGDRVGVVAFAASSYLSCPLTTDLEYVEQVIEGLSPRSIANQGTDIGLGLETAQKALERGSEEGGAHKDDGAVTQAMILISDGEDQEEQALKTAEKLKNTGIKLFVLGIGTEKGGPIPVRDESGNLHGYKRERRGDAIVSTFRPAALTQLAAQAGGHYWNISQDEAEVDEILRGVGALNRTEMAERRFVVYEDRYQWPLSVALILFLLELSFPLRKPESEFPSGSSRPKLGILAVGLFLGLSLGGCDSLKAYQENEKGISALAEGKIEEARQDFGSAQAREPESPALRYNQGVVQSQGGDQESAAQTFSDAAQKAIAKKNPALAGQAFFNQGVIAAKKNDLPSAVKAYLAAIEQAKLAHDQTLEKDARKNIEVLISQTQKQKKEQEQKEQEQKQQQEQQEQKEQKEKQGQKEQEKQGQKKDGEKDPKESGNSEEKEQPKKYEDNSKKRQKFRSSKLSDEDAERVMSELKNREQQLQQKLRKQNAKQQSNTKDW